MSPWRSQYPLAVKKAIGASSARLAVDLPPSVTRDGRTFAVRLSASSELTREDQDAIWTILDRNMSAMSSQSSMGWDVQEKQKELFHPEARFIILSAACAESDSIQPEEQEPRHIVGFSMFRFDYEEGEKLLYCYEVQLDENSRRLGLGHFLMEELIRIGKAWNMEKVMLTVLKVNSDAARFYRRIGFSLDPSSPDGAGEDDDEGPGDAELECDYEILSVTL